MNQLPSKIFVVFTIYITTFISTAFALGQPRYIESNSHPGSFTIAKPDAVTPIYVDGDDYAGVVRAAGDLKEDIKRVTGQTPLITNDQKYSGAGVILIGTIGKSHIIDGLIRDKKINVSSIFGK